MANDNAKVKEEADKLADTFEKVADFWSKRNKEDAVMMANATRDAAKQIADSKTPAEQNAAVAKVQQTCAPCHKEYREGTPGNYKIKS